MNNGLPDNPIIIDPNTQQPKESPPSITTTAELIKRKPNKWEGELKAKGLSFEIPPYYQDTARFPENTHIDPLTGLPIEDDGIRIQIAREFSQCIRDGKNWMMIYGDDDNLKLGNTKHDQEFGDMVIRNGAARLTQAVESASLPDSVSRYATRQTSAADERIVWLFNISDKHMKQIETALEATQNPIVIDNPDFRFSTSVVTLSSKSEHIQPQLQLARDALIAQPDTVAYDTFNELKQVAADRVKLVKVSKDIDRLPIQKLARTNGFNEIRQTLIDDLGDSRIGKILLSHIYDIAQFERDLLWKNGFDTAEQFTLYARKVGVEESRVQCLLNSQPRVIYYQSLLQR